MHGSGLMLLERELLEITRHFRCWVCDYESTVTIQPELVMKRTLFAPDAIILDCCYRNPL